MLGAAAVAGAYALHKYGADGISNAVSGIGDTLNGWKGDYHQYNNQATMNTVDQSLLTDFQKKKAGELMRQGDNEKLTEYLKNNAVLPDRSRTKKQAPVVKAPTTNLNDLVSKIRVSSDQYAAGQALQKGDLDTVHKLLHKYQLIGGLRNRKGKKKKESKKLTKPAGRRTKSGKKGKRAHSKNVQKAGKKRYSQNFHSLRGKAAKKTVAKRQSDKKRSHKNVKRTNGHRSKAVQGRQKKRQNSKHRVLAPSTRSSTRSDKRSSTRSDKRRNSGHMEDLKQKKKSKGKMKNSSKYEVFVRAYCDRGESPLKCIQRLQREARKWKSDDCLRATLTAAKKAYLRIPIGQRPWIPIGQRPL